MNKDLETKVEAFCKRRGISKEEFCEDAIKRALAPYLTNDGEVPAEEVEFNKKKGYVIQKTVCFGEPYYKIWLPDIDHIVKVPRSHIVNQPKNTNVS